MIITLLIWAGFLGATHQLMPKGDSIFNQDVVDAKFPAKWLTSALAVSILPPEELAQPDSSFSTSNAGGLVPHNDYALRVLAWSIGYQLPITLFLMGLTVFLLIWWALPSVLTEGILLRGEKRAPRDTSDKISVRMGTWMSRGLDATAIVTWLLWISIFLVPVLYTLADWKWAVGRTLGPVAFAMVSNTLLGLAVLAAIAKRGQTVLSTVLDVDTYLRTSPFAATPRATIFERYISTLRYLRDPAANGKGYDQVVIVAHSLGALISGDLLQYLQSNLGAKEWYTDEATGPKFTEIPISLMTVGNPARQLLNRFFPYLYDWVRPSPDNGELPLSSLPMTTAEIADDKPPNPSDLGLALWVNAYRSGDYVGRSLWLDEWYLRPAFSPEFPSPTVIASPNGLRQEMCIGAGAHVRYLDDTAPDIAWKLDSLIR
jgi:hypothetical protein